MRYADMENGSGRKNRIVISCVTFDTVKITEPVKFYQATRVHLIRYSKDPNDEKNVFNKFYERVCEIIKEESKIDVEIEPHFEVVFDFTTMLRTILNIIQKEKKEDPLSDVYVNVSAGSSEYSAAAVIASMMIPGTIPFSVGTENYQVPEKYYFDENSRPVGLAKTVHAPKALPHYQIEIHEEYLVRGLRILHERNTKKPKKLPVSSTYMIKEFENAGIWPRGEMNIEDPERKKTADEKKTDSVYYQRDFIYKWQKKEWVVKNELTKRYEVTEKGKRVLETFYTD